MILDKARISLNVNLFGGFLGKNTLPTIRLSKNNNELLNSLLTIKNRTLASLASSKNKKNNKTTETEIESDKEKNNEEIPEFFKDTALPHIIKNGSKPFRTGKKQVYFPSANLIMLRPTGALSPYFVKFQVPLTFNKLDLRDYLWNVYGLRVKTITTHLSHAEMTRFSPVHPRHKAAQKKKMTVELFEPFVWPSPPKQLPYRFYSSLQYINLQRASGRIMGSDIHRPLYKDPLIFSRTPSPVKPFIPKSKSKKL